MDIYVKFTETTHKIWSSHVTLASNSDNFCFSPNFVLNFWKSWNNVGELAQEQKSYIQKTNWRMENTPPSGYRVKSNLVLWDYFLQRMYDYIFF